MSTNFYIRKKLSKHQRERVSSELIHVVDDIQKTKDEILDLVKHDDFHLIERKVKDLQNILDTFSYHMEKETEEIHLGKRSCGWQFLWDYHDGKYFPANFEGIKTFLHSNEIEIWNEYNERFTADEFLNDEVGHCIYEGMNSKNTKDSYGSPSPYEFYSDGLRFSKSEDFA